MERRTPSSPDGTETRRGRRVSKSMLFPAPGDHGHCREDDVDRMQSPNTRAAGTAPTVHFHSPLSLSLSAAAGIHRPPHHVIQQVTAARYGIRNAQPL